MGDDDVTVSNQKAGSMRYIKLDGPGMNKYEYELALFLFRVPGSG